MALEAHEGEIKPQNWLPKPATIWVPNRKRSLREILGERGGEIVVLKPNGKSLFKTKLASAVWKIRILFGGSFTGFLADAF